VTVDRADASLGHRCEPCAHLERLLIPGVLRGLVHLGGLRADVLCDGSIAVGDEVVALEPEGR
jgi:MOSC domain-containing protein YiiM